MGTLKTPRKSNVLVTPAAPVLSLPAAELEPVPSPSVPKMLPSQEPSANGNSSGLATLKSQVQIPVGQNKIETKFDPYAFSEDDFDEAPIPILLRRKSIDEFAITSSAGSDSDDFGMTKPPFRGRPFVNSPVRTISKPSNFAVSSAGFTPTTSANMSKMLPITPQVKPSAAYQSTFDKSIKPIEPNEIKIEMGTCQNFSSNDVTKTISIEIVQSKPENMIANGNGSDLSSQRSQVQDPVVEEFEIDDNLLTPTKRNRRAPSRLIEEDEIESSEKSPKSPKLGPKSPKPLSPKLAPKSPKSPELPDSPKSPGSPIHFDKGFKPITYERTPTKASKESSFEIPEIPEILENLAIEEAEPIEVKVEKPEEIKSGEIEQKLAIKRSTKLDS